MKGKLIIISAPSGSGKSTIIGRLTEDTDIDLKFSVSATNRRPRPGEQDGVDYHFISTDEFKDHIVAGDFVEYEEVYPGRYYGTLKSEIINRLERGENVLLDIDVKGGVNVKRLFGDRALSLFVQPPSVEELRRRLVARGTENSEQLGARLTRAEYELTFAPRFDTVVINDDLDTAVHDAETVIRKFLANP